MDKKTIGLNLNRIRERKAMTIEELAEATNFSKSSVCHHIKNGINSVDAILVYCDALGCDPEEFFFESKKDTAPGVGQTDIEYMELSVRAYHVLRRAGYLFVEDLYGKTSNDLKKIRYLGEKTMKEIIQKAKKFGIDIPLL